MGQLKATKLDESPHLDRFEKYSAAKTSAMVMSADVIASSSEEETKD